MRKLSRRLAPGILAANAVISWIRIQRPQLLGGLLRQYRVKVYLFDAVRFAALFQNRQDLDMPVKIVGKRFPVPCQFAFFI